MLKALVVIAVILVVAIGAVVALALTKPDSITVTRSIAIKASPQKIQPLIDDFHAWAAWSPYEKKDPAMQRNFSGAERGKGAIYQWSGNGEIGSGRMEIVDTTPQRITIKLDFAAPFEAHNVADFTLAPKADATDVTWTMRGPASLLSKIMQVFFDLDKMIGDDFAAGLANLKAAAEK